MDTHAQVECHVCSCLWWVLAFCGCATTTLTHSCQVTVDADWLEGYHVNCSYRRLTEVPRQLPSDTTTLLLNNNDISELQHNVLSNLKELIHLDLSTNKLQSNTLAPDAFSALGSLQHLDLRYNYLCMSNECFPPGLYRPLNSLKVLKLTGNKKADERGLTEYPFRSLSVLHALAELHVSAIRNVDIPSDIALFKSLHVLDLYDGNMRNITATTFIALRNTGITTLSLRNTDIKHVEVGSFSNLPNLRNLNMACNDHIGFKTLIGAVWATENSGIDSFVMDNVELDGIGNKLNFNHVCNTPFAKKLRRLSMRRNNILSIDLEYFGKCLPNVRWLNVGFNTVMFFQRPGRKRTDLLRGFPPDVRVLDFSHYNFIPDDFRLSYCTVHNMPFDDEFRRPRSLMFNTTNEHNISIDTTVYDDDAVYLPPSLRYVFADFVSISTGSHDINSLQIYPKNNIVYVNVSNSKAIRSLSGTLKGFEQVQVMDMSHGVIQQISADFFLHFEKLRIINLSDNKLGEFISNQNETQNDRIFNHLTSLEELDISQNYFQTINENAFVKLTKLRILKLNDNLFKSQLSLNLSRLTSLQSLDLSRNQMAFLSKDLRGSLEELSERVNFSLDIGGNPVSCHTCSSLGFLRWLQTTHVRVVAKDKLTCTENHNKLVVEVSLEGFQALCAPAISGVSMFVAFTLAGGIGLFLLTLLLLYVMRWRMRWYYYSLKRRLRQSGRSEEGHYRYDAVVVYADGDLDFVAQYLMEHVETDWALSLYVEERDSPAGYSIAENIVESLETSRRVLFVLTPNFCDDDWCDFALNMAILRDHKSLVMLCVRSMPHESMSRTLRALLNPHTRCNVIQLGHGGCARALFWQRLHDILLPTPDADMLLYRLAPCIHRPLLFK